jgi:hypothetical protein
VVLLEDEIKQIKDNIEELQTQRKKHEENKEEENVFLDQDTEHHLDTLGNKNERGRGRSSSRSFNTDDSIISLVIFAHKHWNPDCMIFQLKDGNLKVGKQEKSDILLKGLGILEDHAIIKVTQGKSLTVTPIDPNMGKVVVNGVHIEVKKELHHLDRITFGYGTSFKVVNRSEAQNVRLDEEIFDATTIINDRIKADTPEAKNIKKYLEEITERIGKKEAQKFIDDFAVALDEIDEANEYTKVRYMAFPLDKNFVCFSVEVMVDVKEYETDDPEIAIRCRHKRSNEVLFLWRYVKFRERLAEMRKWYDDIKDNGVLDGDYLIDPWMDVSDEDIKRKQAEQKLQTEAKIKRLKERLAVEKSQLEEEKSAKDAEKKKLEDLLSPQEMLQLDAYIEVEILKKKPTPQQKKIVENFNKKDDEIKKLIHEYHSHNTNRIDKTLNIQEIELMVSIFYLFIKFSLVEITYFHF